MGINGLWDLIADKHNHLNRCVPQSSFKGKRIAIDAYCWFYQIRATARKIVVYRRDPLAYPLNEREIDQVWAEKILEGLIKWLALGIIPVIVLDGPAPEKKGVTKLKRKEKKDKLAATYAEIVGMYQHNPLDCGVELLSRAQNVLCQLNSIPPESMELIKTILVTAGVPVLGATGDGERLCAALCVEGIAAAVFSRDGDSLTNMCPYLLRGNGENYVDGNGYTQSTFEYIRLNELLEAMDLTPEQFVDFCIMAGCDYNTNMNKIAAGNSYKLIKQFGSIDNLPPKYDITCLDHHECRQLFSRCPSGELTKWGSVDIGVWGEQAGEIMKAQGLEFYVDRLRHSLSECPPPVNFRHQPLSKVIRTSTISLTLIEDEDSYDHIEGERVLTRGLQVGGKPTKTTKKPYKPRTYGAPAAIYTAPPLSSPSILQAPLLPSSTLYLTSSPPPSSFPSPSPTPLHQGLYSLPSPSPSPTSLHQGLYSLPSPSSYLSSVATLDLESPIGYSLPTQEGNKPEPKPTFGAITLEYH